MTTNPKATCSDCTRECTMGTPDGPPYVDRDGVLRCWRCDRAASEKRARVADAAPDLLASLKEIVDEWGCPNTPKWKRACAAIAKAEGR